MGTRARRGFRELARSAPRRTSRAAGAPPPPLREQDESWPKERYLELAPK